VVRAFAEDVSTPSASLGTLINAHFVKQRKQAKQMRKRVEGLMQRVEANDAGAMCKLASFYFMGEGGVLQDQEKAKELWTQAAELGSSKANFSLGAFYETEGDSKKAKFHCETGAMAAKFQECILETWISN
jgi:TPR repeat protein